MLPAGQSGGQSSLSRIPYIKGVLKVALPRCRYVPPSITLFTTNHELKRHYSTADRNEVQCKHSVSNCKRIECVREISIFRESDSWDTRYIHFIQKKVVRPIRLQQALNRLLKRTGSMSVEVHTLKGEGIIPRAESLLCHRRPPYGLALQ